METVEEREFAGPPTWGEILLSPLKIPELLLRTATLPVKGLIVLNERVDLIDRAIDWFSNENRTLWYYPTLAYSTTDGFAVGATFKNKEFLGDPEQELKLSAEMRTNSDYGFEAEFEREGVLHRPTVSLLTSEYDNDKNAKFYGIGPADEELLQTFYRQERFDNRLRIGWNPRDSAALRLFGEIGHLHVRTSAADPQEGLLAQEEFPELSALGFGESLDFLLYGFGAFHDSRTPDGFPFRGELVEFSYTRGDSLSDGNFGFHKFHLTGQKLFNISRRNRVLALAMLYQASEGFGETVPFHELAALGKDTLMRGYRKNRFRDSKSLSGTVEYRYPVWISYQPQFMYGAATLFVDVGDSFGKFSDLEIDRLKTSAGLGLMVASPHELFARFLFGFSEEGSQFVFSVNREF